MAWIISTTILTMACGVMFFVLRNLLKKNEFMEDFISKQNDAITEISERLKKIDEKGMFEGDDQIGWFWEAMKEIKEALDEFKLR